MKIKAYVILSRSTRFPAWVPVKYSVSSSRLEVFQFRGEAWAAARKLRNSDPETMADLRKYGIKYKTVSVYMEKF